MKKILFATAVKSSSLAENLYPPLWPAFLTAYAERHLGTDRLEFHYGTGRVERLLDRHRPDLLAISSVTQNYGYAVGYAQEAKRRGIPVVIGGMHISTLPTSLSPEMDVACLGEGEETFLELLRLFLETGRFASADLFRIQGVAFRSDGSDGKVIRTESHTHRHEIDRLPHPKRSVIGIGQRAYMYTSRGCAYKCVFCACTKFWGKVRHASADYIVEELEELAGRGTRVVRFADDNFIANVPRFEEIAAKIQRRGLHRRLMFSCWCRANCVTDEIARTLRAMNVISVKLGLESGSQRVLDFLKGDVTVDDNRNAVLLLKKVGMQVNADFLFGAPDETLGEMMETYEFIRHSPIDQFDINIFSPLPGTPVWELAKKRGLVNDESMDWSCLNYKFISDERRAINLSQRLTHGQLKKVHDKFQRLRFLRMLQSLPKSPWRREFPSLALKKCGLMVREWM